MNRHIVYPGQIPLDTDLLNAIQDGYYGLGWIAESVLGTATAIIGLAVEATSPASMQVTVAPGAIYSLQTVDSSAYGSLGTDGNQFVKQGLSTSTQTLTLTAPATVGYSVNYLVQVAFSETDTDAVILPYYNASDPSTAWSGPANAGTSQNTVRQDGCVIQLKAGTPAATGSQTTPSADAGYTGVYVITVANGQTTITSSNISLLATAPYFPTLPQVPGKVQNSEWTYATAGGTSNSLTASISPIPSAYKAGLGVLLKIATTNTGAATLNLNGLGAKTITRADGLALQAGDLKSGSVVRFVYDGANFQVLGLSKKIVLSVDTTFYVSTAGSDSTGDGSSAAPWATIQKAADFLAEYVDAAGFTITIQLATAGTYNGAVSFSKPIAGVGNGNPVVILGSVGSGASYIVQNTSGTALSSSASVVEISGLTIIGTGSMAAACITASTTGGIIKIGAGVIFGATQGTHMLAYYGGFINVEASYTISGGGTIHCSAASGGIILFTQLITVTVSGTPAFSSYFVTAVAAAIDCRSVTFSGSATGTRYFANVGGTINTNGGGANYFPGNAAGSTANGGVYV